MSDTRSITVELGERSYPIFIGSGLLGGGFDLSAHVRGPDCLVVTNETVEPLYLEALLADLTGKQARVLSLPDGEAYKTLETVEDIVDTLVENGANRDTTVVALGGGVVQALLVTLAPVVAHQLFEESLFGLAGAMGALSARHAGVLTDRGHGARLTVLGVVALLVSWGLLGLGGYSLIALIAGIVLLDLALQAVHITNMNMIFNLDEAARNRLNSGYMFLYFVGGALGSLGSAAAYQQAGWLGVCLLGGGLGVLAVGYGVWITRFSPRSQTPPG